MTAESRFEIQVDRNLEGIEFEKVREYLENKVDIWDWEEEVDLINVARVEFK